MNPLVLASLLIALVGLVLLIRGLWPRRRGTTPFCRRCGYNLTGIDPYPATSGERPCPECGLDLTRGDSIVIGARVRRPVLATFGALLLLIGGAPLGAAGIGALADVNWYSKLPTWWILNDLRSDDADVARRALREITKRHKAGVLSAGQLTSLIDACLGEQARTVLRVPVSQMMIDTLGDSTIEPLMTVDQQRRYVNNFMRNISLLIRPFTVSGEPFDVRFEADCRIPISRRCPLRIVSLSCNGRPLEHPNRIGWASGCATFGYGISQFAEPGRAVVRAVVQVEMIDDYTMGMQTEPSLLASNPVELIAVTEVLPAGSTDDVRILRSRSIDAEIVSSIKFEGSFVKTASRSNEFFLSGQIMAEHLPCDVAFDVTLETDGRSWELEDITIHAGAPFVVAPLVSESLRGEMPRTVDIVLRASPDVARRTMDVIEIWGGSLRFGDVPGFRGQPDPRIPAVLEEN